MIDNCYLCSMGRLYNTDEITYLKLNYKKMSNKEMGAKLFRSAASVRKKRFVLELNRTPAELKRIFQRNPNLFVVGGDNYHPPVIDTYNGIYILLGTDFCYYLNNS